MFVSMHPPIPTILRFLAIAWVTPLLCRPLEAIPIRVLAWNSDVAAMHLAFGDAKGSTVIEEMHPSKRTKAYQVGGGDKPLVIEALDRKDSAGKPCTSAIKIPEGVTQPLLVVLPDPKATTGVRLLVLEDNTTNFAWGSTRFINATGLPLVYVCEKKCVTLPASWTPVQSDAGGATRNLEVQFFFHDQPARPFYSAIWEHNTDQRILVFLVPGDDPRLGPVAMKAIPEDRRQIAAAHEAAAKASLR
jgi:hypothetical protein